METRSTGSEVVFLHNREKATNNGCKSNKTFIKNKQKTQIINKQWPHFWFPYTLFYRHKYEVRETDPFSPLLNMIYKMPPITEFINNER